MKFICALVCLFVFSSCSIFGHRELISIDSYPRGLEVKKKNKVIGKTPLFDRERISSDLTYQIGKGQFIHPIKKCGMSWNDPLIDKIPLLKNFLPERLTDFVLEYTPLSLVKGGKYECASIVREVAKEKKETDKEQPTCKKFLIITPPAKDEMSSLKISQEWIKANFSSYKNSCDKVIPPKAAADFLEFHGLHFMKKSYGIQYMMYGLMARMGYKLKATHLVFLAHDQSSITPEIYDIHSRLRNIPELEKAIPLDQGYVQKESFIEKLANTFKLIPNSASLRFKFKRYVHLEPEENENLYTTRVSKLDLIPSIILSNIDYPLKTWGTNFRFSPSLSYKSWEEQYKIKYAHIVMALKLFAHTPIGTFIGRLGGGYGYVDVSRLGGGFQQKESVWVAQWGGSYYKFFGDRYFAELGFRRNQIRTKKIVDGAYHFKGISEVYLAFGLYLPEFNTKVKSFFYN